MQQIHNVYVSTGAFKTKNVREILTICRDARLTRLELSSGAYFTEDMLSDLKEAIEKHAFSFLVHNYFPPPDEPFVINLASPDHDIREKSLGLCRRAVDLSVQLGAPFYSVHCGFCGDVPHGQLGKVFCTETVFNREQARDLFVAGVSSLADYAAQRGIGLAIENNVVAPFNLRNGENVLFLGATSSELWDILDRVAQDNVGLLIDVGHLKVSAKSLGFSAIEFVRHLADRIVAFHLSDNDGLVDSNQHLEADSWIWEVLTNELQRLPICVLEVYNISVKETREQIDMIQTHLQSYMNMCK